MVSLDGFAAGPNGEFDWPLADEEFERHANELLDGADTLLLGRNTYQMFASYWPTAASSATGAITGPEGADFAVPTSPSSVHDEVARKMNSYRKVVFSKSLGRVEWANSTLVRDVVPAEITEMKRQPGKNMLLLGSLGLAGSFMRQRLVDEYRIWVNPVLLGKGRPLFGEGGTQRLEFLGTKTFKSGLTELHYQSQT
jgi:dihydrofolate reductase